MNLGQKLEPRVAEVKTMLRGKVEGRVKEGMGEGIDNQPVLSNFIVRDLAAGTENDEHFLRAGIMRLVGEWDRTPNTAYDTILTNPYSPSRPTPAMNLCSSRYCMMPMNFDILHRTQRRHTLYIHFVWQHHWQSCFAYHSGNKRSFSGCCMAFQNHTFGERWRDPDAKNLPTPTAGC